MNFKTFFKEHIMPKSSRKMAQAYEQYHYDTLDHIKDSLDLLDQMDAPIIGKGGAARVHAYPLDDKPDLVLRISPSTASGSDGWVQYAETLRQNWQEGTPHYGPLLLDVGHHKGVWMSITPKLSPVDTDNAHHLALITAARKIIDPDRHGAATPAEIKFMQKSQPGFIEFANTHLGNASDLGYANFMMDGNRLIVNDPIGTMDPQFEADMKAKYDMSHIRRRPEMDAPMFD